MNTVVVSTNHSHCSYHIYRPNQSDCPLILLHGTNSDGLASYGSLLNAFDHREIIVPDYAGCGDSSLPEHELTTSALADQVVAIINERGSKKIDLVGHSLGATVAAYVAAQYPDFINRLVLSVAMAFDTLVPPYRAQEVQAAISNSEYDEIPSGHAVQLESPYPWVNRIRGFL